MSKNPPAEGSDRQFLGFVIVELPQREEGALLPEVIRHILKVFEIWTGMKGGEEEDEKKGKFNNLNIKWNCSILLCHLTDLVEHKPCAMSSNVFWLTIRSKILETFPTLLNSSFYNRDIINDIHKKMNRMVEHYHMIWAVILFVLKIQHYYLTTMKNMWYSNICTALYVWYYSKNKWIHRYWLY